MALIQAVFFDVGETIVDETREYGTWADWFSVPRHTFSAVFGAVIARGEDYRETFQYFEPGFDLAAERQRRAAVGQPEAFAEENLYPDARPCLAALGMRVGLAGNQTARAGAILRSLDFPVDVIGTLDGWGVEKPTAGFFDRVIVEAGCTADAVLYVGDRLDNDIRLAQAAGMATALIRRGPWGYSCMTRKPPTAACSICSRLQRCPIWLPSTTPTRDSSPQPPGKAISARARDRSSTPVLSRPCGRRPATVPMRWWPVAYQSPIGPRWPRAAGSPRELGNGVGKRDCCREMAITA